ncbi:unnamed protein product [Darwinula stevensoni]|uniref:Peptidase S1 domain-containing protein n=1 Tax=Darwinula stevensoni TaxID=69355 RepID=A0A7R9AEY2_9CRUS|nr:unnamed protein product [Darwinula stevensoni]CAG0902498.1 unnamed protein product [Darwinula stevensoni]
MNARRETENPPTRNRIYPTACGLLSSANDRTVDTPSRRSGSRKPGCIFPEEKGVVVDVARDDEREDPRRRKSSELRGTFTLQEHPPCEEHEAAGDIRGCPRMPHGWPRRSLSRTSRLHSFSQAEQRSSRAVYHSSQDPIPRLQASTVESRSDSSSGVDRGEAPFNVLLQVFCPATGWRTCTGTVINEGNVLTAAHCLVDRHEACSGGYAVAGKTRDGSAKPGSRGQTKLFESFSYHENWNPNRPSGGYDIAIVYPSGGFVLDDFLQPICIPDSDGDDIGGCNNYIFDSEVARDRRGIELHERNVEPRFADRSALRFASVSTIHRRIDERASRSASMAERTESWTKFCIRSCRKASLRFVAVLPLRRRRRIRRIVVADRMFLPLRSLPEEGVGHRARVLLSARSPAARGPSPLRPGEPSRTTIVPSENFILVSSCLLLDLGRNPARVSNSRIQEGGSSPLVTEYDGKFFQTGIESSCSSDTGSGTGSIPFTRVSRFAAWIRANLK